MRTIVRSDHADGIPGARDGGAVLAIRRAARAEDWTSGQYRTVDDLERSVSMDQLSTAVRPVRAASLVPSATADVRRVIVLGLLATAVMVALLAATQLVDFGVFDLRIGALDTDTHASVFGAVSLLAQAAAAAAVVWRGSATKQRRAAWLALGAVVGGLVLVRIFVTYRAETVAAPLACMVCLLCWLTWREHCAARTVVWVALALMMTSLLLHEVGLDADVLNYSDQSWAYQLTAVAKHGSELAGWMLLATALVAGARAPGARGRT